MQLPFADSQSVAGSLAVCDRWVCDNFSGMNSCCWQNRIIDTDLHGSLLHNSAPCCSAVAEIARSLPSLLVYSHILRLPHLLAPWPHGVFVYCPELSAKHFAEFPFLLLRCNLLFCGLSQLCKVSYFFGCSFPEREQLLHREAGNTKWDRLKWVARQLVRWNETRCLMGSSALIVSFPLFLHASTSEPPVGRRALSVGSLAPYHTHCYFMSQGRKVIF